MRTSSRFVVAALVWLVTFYVTSLRLEGVSPAAMTVTWFGIVLIAAAVSARFVLTPHVTSHAPLMNAAACWLGGLLRRSIWLLEVEALRDDSARALGWLTLGILAPGTGADVVMLQVLNVLLPVAMAFLVAVAIARNYFPAAHSST